MVTFIGAPEGKKKKLAAVQAQNQYVVNNTPFVPPTQTPAPTATVATPQDTVETKLDLTYKAPQQDKPFMGTESSGTVSYRNPVATSQKPVVGVDIVPPKTGMTTTPDYSSIASLDVNGLQDYINTQSVRQQTGQKLTPEDIFNVQKAQQLMAQKTQEAQVQGVQGMYQSEIAQAQQEREQKAQELKSAAVTAAEKYRNSILGGYADKKQQAYQQGQQVLNAAGRSLSFSGVGRSTYGAEKQAEIQDHVNTTMDYLNQEMEAAVARFEAEQQGADSQILAGYDDYIRQLQKNMADSVSEQIKAMNEYNAKNAASYQDKVNNILQLAQQQTVVPVTEEDLKTADAYAALAINGKGEINASFLQTVPAYLVPHVLKKAAELKGAIDTTPQPEYQYVPGSEFSPSGVFNKTTGKFEAAPQQQYAQGGGGGGGGATLADRNNNPGNLRSSNAVDYTPGEGGFAKFATPEEGFRALEADISAKVNGKSNAAVNLLGRQAQNLQELISVYAPTSDGNNPQAYAQSVASMLGISPTTPVEQLRGMIPQLAKAMAKHEGYTGGVQSGLDPMFQAYAKNGNIPDDKDLRPLGLNRSSFVKQYEVRKDQQPDSTGVTKEQAVANRAVMSKLQTDPTITNYLSLLNSKRSIDSIMKSGVNESNKGVIDQAIIMLFNKALDPNSVVREGEYARSSEGQALLGRIEAWYNTYAYGGQNISSDTRKEMVRAISTLESAAKQGINMTRDRLKATAVDMGGTEQFVDNYFKGYIKEDGVVSPTVQPTVAPVYGPAKPAAKPSKAAEDYLSSLGY